MRVLSRIELNEVLFFDIETTSSVPELIPDTPLYDTWEYKVNKSGEMTQEQILQSYTKEAALYSEFGRIVCISVGMLRGGGFKLKTFSNKNEKELIESFYSFLDKLPKNIYLCGHSAKIFDIPWIYQRSIINNVKPHTCIDTSGLKPWEITWILDTKELFQVSSFSRPSLLGIATAIGLPSPKDVISGKDVPKFYWKDVDKNTPIIAEYCEKDVYTTYKIFEHFKDLGKEKEIKKSLVTRLFEGSSYGVSEKEELKTILRNLTTEERSKAYVILSAMCSNAKGKKTKIQKKDITELKKELK